ncbi:IS4 family transposase [Pyxidicoccus parkwayensis]|uniref:IS4 family transposase n=1 Tax=Pyxidicoccus parkwayensis TaxID=2813578 RepID=A0ABX7P289_9BACT|nr:IS4 family transposase [Pyxidicoccus parkwaysis]QSQ24637.1 IS4 family transposase [Pyxidicoccus parkwaysis]
MPQKKAAAGTPPCSSAQLPAVAEEYASAALGDARRTQRLVAIAERLAPAPDTSFPVACRGAAELEGCYRLLSNQKVAWEDVLAPHIAQSLERCRAAAAQGHPLVVAHDTTNIRFLGSEAGVRTGLGTLSHGESGFEAHLALACALPAPQHLLAHPLGVVGLHPHVRASRPKRSLAQQKKESQARPPDARESEMWQQLAYTVQQRCTEAGVSDVVHVMDQEADSFRLFSMLMRQGCAFVIRTRFDRRVDAGASQTDSARCLHAALEAAPVLLTREVSLGAAKAKWKGRNGGAPAKKQPAREGRTAHLEVRARGGLVLKASEYSQRDEDVPAALTLNAVEVVEPYPPEGQPPVRWVLLTTLPVDTPEAVAHVVDCYRARWSVEELFKALKTGCALEKRQLMSLHALLNALALLLPLAWRLLALRTLAHQAPATAATDLFSPDEMALLRHLSVRVTLGPEPTCGEALLALAGLGGHLKYNGRPGWQTLARGQDRLSSALEGWLAARALSSVES